MVRLRRASLRRRASFGWASRLRCEGCRAG